MILFTGLIVLFKLTGFIAMTWGQVIKAITIAAVVKGFPIFLQTTEYGGEPKGVEHDSNIY